MRNRDDENQVINMDKTAQGTSNMREEGLGQNTQGLKELWSAIRIHIDSSINEMLLFPPEIAVQVNNIKD